MRTIRTRRVLVAAATLLLALASGPDRAGAGPLALAMLASVEPAPAVDPDLDVRARFDASMAAILADLPGVIVTSKQRTDADQERIAALGYKPHRHSQHKRGLAWDCAAPHETLETIRDRARAHGLTALIMTSPVTGVPYIHVQRFPRRYAPPVDGVAPESPVVVAEADDVAEPAAGAPAPEDVLTPEEAAEEVALAPFDGPRPKPIGVERLDLPRELRTKKTSGRIVLLVRLDPEGKVLDLAVDSSDLPDFEPFVVAEVRQWRFTPPTRQGQPVEAYARLPIPIHVN